MTADDAMRVPAGPDLDRLVAQYVMAGMPDADAAPWSTSIERSTGVLCHARGEPPCPFCIRDYPGPEGGYLVTIGDAGGARGAEGLGRGKLISEAVARAAVDKALRAAAL